MTLQVYIGWHLRVTQVVTNISAINTFSERWRALNIDLLLLLLILS